MSDYESNYTAYKKMWICSPQLVITINNARIKTISIDETYK